MSLKDRLSRLGAGPPGLTKPAIPAAPAAPSAPSDRADVLEELRTRMAALLSTTAAPAPRPPAPEKPFDWPFEKKETRAGTIGHRAERLAPSHHVGRIPVDAARQASGAMLGLLALDPSLSEVDWSRALYLDTETTGLGGAGTVAFLVGMAWFDDDGHLVLEQLLLESPSDERALLALVEERVERASALVSFNGKSFDWPLLESRAVMNQWPSLPRRPHLDLLHVGRRLHKARLGGCRLIHLEAHVLGWERGDDDIPGIEIAPRYGHFLRTGDVEALRAVVDHNAWDVVTMAALVGLYGEPIDLLHPLDLLGAAETARRAKAFDQARELADASRERGGGLDALRVRAHVEKARGDRARALLDFEELSQQIDDPQVRFELVKLYEHHTRDYESALRVLEQGTGEDDAAISKRKTRLETRQTRSNGSPRRR